MPAAWDLVRISQGRVLVVTIQPPDMKVSMAWSEMRSKLELPPGSDNFRVSGMPYHAARNIGIKAAMDQGYGSIFFLDADTVPPNRVVMDLLATQRDLIAGLYFKRGAPYLPAAAMAALADDGNLLPGPLPAYQAGEIIPVDFLPTGCTLISRRCIEAMFQAYERPYDWGVDVARVPDGQGGFLPGISEDFMFSSRAKALGFQPWLHTGQVCKHELLMTISDKGLQNIE